MISFDHFTGNRTVVNHDKQDLALGFAAAMICRNWGLLQSILAEEVTWLMPGTSLISGEAYGADEVIKKSEMIAVFAVRFQFYSVFDGSGGIAFLTKLKGSNGALFLDEDLVITCTIEAGEIVAINTFLSRVEAVNNFFMETM